MLLPPILQLLFTSFEYPGISIGHEAIRLHLFSGPVLITLITNILATLTIVFLFSEPASLEQMKIQETLNKGKQSEKFESCSFGVKTMNFLKNPSFSWHLISMICLAKVAIYASNATVTVVHSAWSQIAFGWSSSETVIKLTNAKIYLGIVSITITLVLFKLGKKIGDHVVLLICSLFILSHFIITYPMPELATLTTPLYNETTHGGCNEIEYSWCGARVGNSDVWVYSSVALMVIAVQIALVSSDAIFSNLLEKIDQSMMQGLLIVLSDAVQMIASMYSADLFTRWGLEPLWILNIFISIFVVFVSIFYFKRFKL
ncbi:unnamed protein product, partial [Mesorhabditis belari]|uniref:Uncharacterized protein n=1 Tax=Mesorhabditis belari TaxID=2138241 RepID=A0AAF3FKA3_9BILA